MFLPWFHQLQSLADFLFEFLRVVQEFFLGFRVWHTPFMLVGAHQWIVDVFDHVTQHFHWVWSYLSEEDLFTIGLSEVHLYSNTVYFLFPLWEISHEPYSFIFNPFGVSVGQEQLSIDYVVVVVGAGTGIRSLVVDQQFWRTFTLKKELYLLLVGFMSKNCILD